MKSLGRALAETEFHFAGFEWQDTTAADLDPTLNRNYSMLKGRWMSPDPPRPLPGSSTGGDVSNPQSLNRYAYVLNNPATFVDPLGLIAVNTNPADPCAYASTGAGDASCSSLPGLWDNGQPIWGGGGGGGGGVTAGGGSTPGGSAAGGGVSGGLGSNWSLPGWGPCPPSGPPDDPWPGPGPCFKIFTFVSYVFPLGASLPAVLTAPPGDAVGKTPFFLPFPPFSGVHYCGPGSAGGEPINGVDAACQQHDQCYADAGLNASTAYDPFHSLPPQKQVAKAVCNQQLCNRLPGIVTFSPQENADQFLVGAAFGCIP